jgi:hypothetical protein
LLKEQLRTPSLKPQFSISESHPEGLREQLVEELVEKRAALLSSQEPHSFSKNDIEKAGRLLFYFPNDNLADGAAQYSSNGFFDVDNVPPWDTWVHYSERTLVSWVPHQVVVLAQKGIDVNPEMCIRWID